MSRKRYSGMPPWLELLLHWVGIVTTVIGAFTALLVGIGKFGEAAYAPCGSFPSLPWCVAPTPPKLTPYDSPRVGGGHTQAEYCEPKAAAYRSQFPDYEINWKASEASDKDLLGHVTYVYHCEFFATPKPKRRSGLIFTAITLTAGLAILGFLWWRRRSRST